MPTRRLTDKQCLEGYTLWVKHGSYALASSELGCSDNGVRLRVQQTQLRNLLNSDVFYAPPPPPPKLRISVSHLKNDPGWDGDVLAIGDMHDSPRLNKDRFLWCGRAAVELNVNKIIQIGDFLSVD